MITFEYKVMLLGVLDYSELEQALNRYGAEGFSVVTTTSDYIILQRTVRTA